MKIMKAFWLVVGLILIQFAMGQNDTTHSLDLQEQKDMPFPKILWTFWSQGYEHAPLFTKLCINNLAHFARLSGWQVRFLTLQNYTLALSPQNINRMQKMIETSQYNIEVMHFADILRIFLIHEHGGMWIDANSFFLGDLSWMTRLERQSHVYNQISGQPSVLTFTYNKMVGGNKSIVVDGRTNQSVYMFPGIQTWAFAAKPACLFFKDMLNSLERSLNLGYEAVSTKNKESGLKFGNQGNTYFFIGSYQCQMVLQLKQQQLDQAQTGPTTAVEYYGIWSIDAASSALMIPLVNQEFPVLITQSLLKQSLATWKKQYGLPSYFVKLTGQYYPYVNMGVAHAEALGCLGVNMTAEIDSIYYQFLYTPSRQILELSKFDLSLIHESEDCSLFDDYFASVREWMMLFSFVVIFLGILFTFICGMVVWSKREEQSSVSVPLRNGY